ncbi:hypothetical protein EV714DRAFT_271723 [Schizophyllum commune]
MPDRFDAFIHLTDVIDPNTPTNELNAVIEQLRHWLRRGQVSFGALSVDPFLLNESHWDLHTPTILKGIHSLQALGILLLPEFNRSAPLRALVAGHVRNLWPSLVAWVDYLHPIHHARTNRLDNCPIPTLASVFQGLFSIKHLLSDLFETTPRMYQLLFDLWLKLGRYCDLPKALIAEKRLYLLFMSVNHAILDNTVPPVTSKTTKIAKLDLVAKDAILWPVNYRPRSFFHSVMRVLGLAAGALPSNASATTPGFGEVFMNQLRLVGALAEGDIRVLFHSRKTVLATVSLLRRLISNAADLDLSEGALDILKHIWYSSGDRQSLLWALRVGAFDLITSLQEKRSTEPVIEVLNWVIQQGMYVNVLRALVPNGRYVGAYDPHGWLNARAIIMRQAFLPPFCASSECPLTGSSGQQVKRCACQLVRYCSSQCQKADWPAHRILCHSIRANSNADVLRRHADEISPMDHRFIILCARYYIKSDLHTMISEIQSFGFRHGHIYTTLLDFASTPPRRCPIICIPTTEVGLPDYPEMRPIFMVAARVATLGLNVDKKSLTIQVCAVPVEWLLQGFEPMAAGWKNASGDQLWDDWHWSQRH